MSNTTQPTFESQLFDPDAPVVMPTPESQRRLALYMSVANAAEAKKIPISEFRGLVLLSLLVHGSDEIWEESIAEALETLTGGAA